jgi:hypothetical protein
MSNADIVEFHQYSEWLRKQAGSSTDWLVTKSEEYLREFLAFDRELPDRYGWHQCLMNVALPSLQLKLGVIHDTGSAHRP